MTKVNVEMANKCSKLLMTSNCAKIEKYEEIDNDNLMLLLTKYKDKLEGNEHNTLKKMKKRITQLNKLKVDYILPKLVKGGPNANLNIGRLTAEEGIGLQGLRRDIRNFLARKNYFDIDIQNSQPNIACQLFKKYEAGDTTLLETFIGNRNAIYDALAKSLYGGNKDTAKGDVLSLFFDYGPGGIQKAQKFTKATVDITLPNGFTFVKFYNEITGCGRAVLASPDWASEVERLKACSTSKTLGYNGNEQGSCFAYVLQTVERGCLMLIDEGLRLSNRKMDTLIHDGGYVRKLPGEVTFPEEVLRAVEKHVYKEFGFSLRLEEKQMVSSIDKLVILDALAKNDEEAFFKKQVVEFESKWFYYPDDNLFFSCRPKTHLVLNNKTNTENMVYYDEIKQYEKAAVFRLFKESSAIYRILDAPFDIKKWESLEEPKHKKTNDIGEIINTPSFPSGIIRPTDEDVINGKNYNKLNLFTQMPYPKPDNIESIEIDHEIIEPMTTLIRDLVSGSGDSDTNYDFIINYFAQMIQMPAKKTNSCIIIIGGHGVGKDTMFNLGIGALLGNSYVVLNNPGIDLFSRFNDIIKNKILVKGEELAFRDTKQSMETFKSMITAPTIGIESKNEAKLNMISYHNYCFTTNSETPIAIQKGDRRFCIFKARDKDPNKTPEFWNQLNFHCKSEKFKREFANYLWKHKIPEGWDAYGMRPRTGIYDEIKNATAEAHAQFFNEMVQNLAKEELEMKYGGSRFYSYDATNNVMVCKTTRIMESLNNYMSALTRKQETYYNDSTFDRLLKTHYGLPKKGDESFENLEIPATFRKFKRGSGVSFIQINFNLLIDLLKEKDIYHEIN